MATPPTARSLPPPVLPAAIVVQSRLRMLTAELDAAATDATRAVLSYEIGALHEHRIGDAHAAEEWYRRARDLDRGFRPALLALLRLRPVLGSTEQMSMLWEAAGELAPSAEARALAFVEQGLALTEAYGASRDAAARWEKALAADPGCQAAALLLERHHRGEGHTAEADRFALARAEATADPGLRAELVLEVAERDGDPVRVLALLDALGPGAFDATTLERIAEVLRRAERWRELAAVLSERARTADASTAAALLREVGRIEARRLGDLHGAKAAYARALVLAPGDGLILAEQADVARMAGDVEGERNGWSTLLAAGREGGYAALLELRLAELAHLAHDPEGARAALMRADETAPDAARVVVAVEDSLLGVGALEALRDHLVRRARASHGAARSERLRQAAWLSVSDLGADAPARALLAEAAAATADDPDAAHAIAIARETYGFAAIAGDAAAQRAAAAALEVVSDDPGERAELSYDRYRQAADDPDAAHAALDAALGTAEHAAWAPHAARAEALLRGDAVLLAKAHAALATIEGDEETFVAHGCAAARALVRAGSLDAAVERLRAVLARRPGEPYAVVLLEEALLAKGETREAVRVLLDAAHARAHRERALLRAGVAAAQSGDTKVARESYASAAEETPGALSALWALRRLAERGKDASGLLDALVRLARREAVHGGSGSAALELGEHYDTIGDPDAAHPWLTRALGQEALQAAATIDLLLVPGAARDAETRERLARVLGAERSAAVRGGLTRDALADAVGGDAAQVHALLAAGDLDAGAAATGWAELCTARDAAGFARALERLARATEGSGFGAELGLAVVRCHALVDHVRADEAARALAAQAPDTFENALARGEATDASAEERTGAALARLSHSEGRTGDGLGASLRAARARALLGAGRLREAADSARREVTADPDALDMWEALLGAAFGLDDWATVSEAADRLAAAAEGSERAALLELSAVTLADELGQPAEAEARLWEALAAAPERPGVFERLHDLLVTRQDFDGLLELLQRGLMIRADDAVALDLAWECALIERARGNREPALARLDHVLALDPQHVGALGLKAETHTALKQWSAAVDALRALARAPVPAAQKRLAHLGAADFLERRLDDPAAAHAELEELQRAGLGDPGVLDRMATLARNAGMPAKAARAYEEAAHGATGAERAALERKVGALYDELGAAEQAVAAYGRALEAWPTDVEALEEILPYLEPEDRAARLAAMQDAVLRELAEAPLDTQWLRLLRRLGRAGGDPVLERTALGALHALREANSEEDRAWATMIAHDTAGPRIAALTLQALDALRTERARGPAAALCAFASGTLDDDARSLPSGARADPALLEALGSIVGAFGIALGGVVPGPSDAPDAVAPLETSGDKHVWGCGRDVRVPLTPRQRFAVGRHAMALRLGVAALLGKEERERRDALRAAIALATGKSADESVRARARALEKALSRAARRAVRDIVEQIGEPETDTQKCIRALERTCLRAGLVCADDPTAALASVLGAEPDPERVREAPEALDLLRFWVSPARIALTRRTRGAAS